LLVVGSLSKHFQLIFGIFYNFADVKNILSTHVGDWAFAVNYVVVVFILVA